MSAERTTPPAPTRQCAGRGNLTFMLPLSVAQFVFASELPQEVRLEVVAECQPNNLAIEVTTQWLGEARTMTLRDDGVLPEDRARDGVYVGVWTGETARSLPLRLSISATDVAPTEVSASTETVAVGRDRIVWALECEPQWRARRVAAALPSRSLEMVEATGVAATLSWLGLILAYLAWLLQGQRAPAGDRP